MTGLLARLRDVQDALDLLARRHRVPGATLAIALHDQLVDFATGVINVDTGVETTTDTIFQIGSITKLFTTTLVMQLVDVGEVDLDGPVRRYLTDFALDDPTAAAEITVRQLLTHTSGIQGDYFQGFGRGEDAIEHYVEALAQIDMIHRPGQMWSYCNSGFVVAGRLAEVVTGLPYHQLLKDRICDPLSLPRTTIRVEEMVAQRCAVGHVPGPDGRPTVPRTVFMEYAQAPAGSLTASTAAELARFALMHLNRGAGPDETRVLDTSSVRAMQQVQVPMPLTTTPSSMGLGWMIQDWEGKRVLGHDGGTIGQVSFLEAMPDTGLVIALLTNSLTGDLLWRDLGRWLFDELGGVRMPSAPEPADPPPDLDLSRYAGVYERLGARHTVTVQDGALVMVSEPTGLLADMPTGPAPRPVRLRPVDTERFVGRIRGMDGVVVFLEFNRGRPRYLSLTRAARRVPGRR